MSAEIALLSEGPKVNLNIIYNPFDTTDRQIDELVYRKGASLADYLEGLPEDIEWAVSLNGGIVAEDAWKFTSVREDDWIVIMPIPQGGEGGLKSILRIVAFIVLVVVTYGYGASLAGAMGLSGYVGAVQAGMMLVGGILINTLFPVAPPAIGGAGNGFEDSPSYGIDGAKNTAQSGLPIPVVYGKTRVAGNIVQLFTENVGKTQDLYLQNVASEGPIKSISALEINNQPAENFDGVETQFRLGTDNQPIVPWFNGAKVSRTVGTRMTTTWFTVKTQSAVDKLRLDFVCPAGLLRVEKSTGNMTYQSVQIRIRYRRTTGGAWVEQTIMKQDKTRSPVRFSWSSPALSHDFYEVQVSRVTEEDPDSTLISEQVQWSDLLEIQLAPVRYNHTAFYGLKVRLTDQLTSLPTVTALVEGRLLDHYDEFGEFEGNYWDDNPAWIALDIMTSKRYGGGIAVDRIDLPRFYEWAERCESEGFKFNGIFDFQTNVWDALQNVFRVGHAQIINVGTRYSLAIDKPDDPVMMFDVGNIVEDSFALEWTSLDDRANDIEVRFANKENGYREDFIKLYDQEANANGVDVKSTSVTILGIDNAEQATREAYSLLAQNKHINMSCSFRAPLEAIACTLGDLIYVQHDIPQWGEGGRLAAGSSETVIRLDRRVQLNRTESNRFLTHFPAMKLATTTVFNRSGNTLYLNGTDEGLEKAKRLRMGSVDLEIVKVNVTSHVEVTVVENASSIPVGAAVELWDIDRIEERTVATVEADGMFDVITLTSPLSEPPAIYQNFMIGPVERVKKMFRVTQIAGSHEYERTIRAVEYNESVYETPRDVVPTTVGAITQIGQSRVVSFREELEKNGTSIQTRVFFSWVYPSDGTLQNGAQIYASINNGAYESVGVVPSGITDYSIIANEGDVVRIKAITLDAIGGRANFNSAPIGKWTVVGKLAPPANVQNFTVRKTYGGMEMEWDAVPDLDIAGYEIRQGRDWDAANVLVTGHRSTSFFASKSRVKTGDFVFLIRAIDTSGQYSSMVTSYTFENVYPGAPSNFQVVQNRNQLFFSWTRSESEDALEYEIREGATWGNGIFAGRAAGESFRLSSDVDGPRTFWIKTIDFAGFESREAVFFKIEPEQTDQRNVLVNINAEPYWDGPKINMSAIGGSLYLDDGAEFGEYVKEIELLDEFNARNVLNVAMNAILTDNTTWADAGFAWNTVRAGDPWAFKGDFNAVDLRHDIARFVGNDDDAFVEQFRLRDDANGLTGVAPVTEASLAYEAGGRFGDGARLTDVSRLSWTLDTGEVFSITEWANFQNKEGVLTLLKLSGAGIWLEVRYDTHRDVFLLVDHLDQIIETSPLVFEEGEKVMIGISQSEDSRALFVGRSSDLENAFGQASLAPAGAYTAISLHRD